ncbi:uncharacterized protein TNIN_381651 [Trichonephila inaurata madagascariensis]|uniref:Uncharacterized protein n=1 Tax=Trichonephila inaurata madagascariensis TaxID=2747483 RepID=A0A8X6YNK4_9ARAC|nr:uncharacterized protein TNIN_381651 [Trichonephila inaurata madagascariensis]
MDTAEKRYNLKNLKDGSYIYISVCSQQTFHPHPTLRTNGVHSKKKQERRVTPKEDLLRVRSLVGIGIMKKNGPSGWLQNKNNFEKLAARDSRRFLSPDFVPEVMDLSTHAEDPYGTIYGFPERSHVL